MESHTLIQDKLSEWNLSKLINRFEDEQINDETFLSLDTSAHLEVLIPKTGPRVKFRKRLQEYKQSLNRQHEEEMMETNVDSHHMSTVSFPSQSLCAHSPPGHHSHRESEVCTRLPGGLC
ncbi:uncharacterized protein LOC117375568 isoform X3 [Periophthalmus magnuspinnatus]|uniref:uncharacterized protein LOC117375568 isoform X3 n=1 Tax=Periophthalmus magnuspinnatus TaxID=409849 RepID=UPI0024364EC5|nr:uncharacterized protein LOC117375568 isoform X3 [Periophthalmus magnuspinnatus]